MTLESWTGGDTFADGVRALIADVKDLRARLAKYEDAEGRPVVSADCAKLIQELRGIDIRHAMGFALDITGKAADALESQAREIERLGLMVSQADFNYDQDRAQFELELAALKAQPSVVDERAAFEAFVQREWPGTIMHRRDALPADHERYGEYVNAFVAHAWDAWQARAAISAPSHGGQVPEALPNEVLGSRCADGGKCHHGCTRRCFRREACTHFSDYKGPWAYATPSAGSQGGDV